MKPQPKDPLAILAALNAAIAPKPQKMPEGWHTVKEWGKMWGVGESGATRKLRRAFECGYFARMKISQPLGAPALAYGLSLNPKDQSHL